MLHFVDYSRISLNKLMQFDTIALLVIGFAYALKFGSFNRNLAVCMKHLYQCNLSVPETSCFVVGFRPPPDQIPSAARLDSVRCPIGFRTLSDEISYSYKQH